MHAAEEVQSWLATRARIHAFDVERVPLHSLEGWYFEDDTGNLRHRSGRFFSVEGLAARVDVPASLTWSQPIINQPEVGIVGFMVRDQGDGLAILAHAKMEPGNGALVQLSPTLQATRSNYTRAHGGRTPTYLADFANAEPSSVLASIEQSEQGSRFFRKRNRNMVVVDSDSRPMEVHEDFAWVDLAAVLELLRTSDVVNMDARSILASAPGRCLAATEALGEFGVAVRRSILGESAGDTRSDVALEEWFGSLQARQRRESGLVPLCELDEWHTGETIRHAQGRHFEVVGVRVTAPTREVLAWSQPLIRQVGQRVIVLFCQRRADGIRCVVQGRAEPGGASPVELSGSVHFDPLGPYVTPALAEHLPPHGEAVIRFDSSLPEEGGRFYHTSNRYIVAELDTALEPELPSHLTWMTPAQMKKFVDRGMVTVEGRTLFLALFASK
jgi:dTDP-4-dehydro-6-deoxy-alpha-D-glucopyranose 2,3-dehydratase